MSFEQLTTQLTAWITSLLRELCGQLADQPVYGGWCCKGVKEAYENESLSHNNTPGQA